MISVFNSALGGLERSQLGLQEVAHNVARFGTDRRSGRNAGQSVSEPTTDVATERDVELAAEFVEAKTHQTAFRANAKVVSVADDMLGELLDVLA